MLAADSRSAAAFITLRACRKDTTSVHRTLHSRARQDCNLIIFNISACLHHAIIIQLWILLGSVSQRMQHPDLASAALTLIAARLLLGWSLTVAQSSGVVGPVLKQPLALRRLPRRPAPACHWLLQSPPGCAARGPLLLCSRPCRSSAAHTTQHAKLTRVLTVCSIGCDDIQPQQGTALTDACPAGQLRGAVVPTWCVVTPSLLP